VGSLVPAQHPDLLQVPRHRFQPVGRPGRLDGVEAYRTRKRVFGQEYTVLVTFNEKLLEGQLQGLSANLVKARHKLQTLQKQLQRRREGKVQGGKSPTEASLKKQVQQILSAQWVASLLKVQLRAVSSGWQLLYHTDTTALACLTRTQLGKTLLFTDNDSWTDEQIVLAYRSQYHIEDAFKQMKNPHFLGWSPMYHWTDSKIRVHALSCVLALLLTSLLQRTLAHQGESLSINRILEELGAIRETLVIYPRQQGQKKFPAAACLTHRNPLQAQLFQLLRLDRYQPTAS
jgi:transposase